MNLPTLLAEQQIRSFNYYWKGEVRPGMTSCGRLYALLDCFSERERTSAYEKACQLAGEHDVVLTVSQEKPPHYRLWIALSSGTNLSLLSRVSARCSSCNISSNSNAHKTSYGLWPSPSSGSGEGNQKVGVRSIRSS